MLERLDLYDHACTILIEGTDVFIAKGIITAVMIDGENFKYRITGKSFEVWRTDSETFDSCEQLMLHLKGLMRQ